MRHSTKEEIENKDGVADGEGITGKDRGKKKINFGKEFEKDFRNSFTDEIFSYRLRDSSASWQGNDKDAKSKSRFTPSNMCDFIVFSQKHSKLYLFELKSFQGKSCPFGNLKIHQVEELYKAGKKDGIFAGFIFNFRTLKRTFYINAEKIHDFYTLEERKSFSLEWCISNGLELESTINRTRYRYNIDKFLDDLGSL